MKSRKRQRKKKISKMSGVEPVDIKKRFGVKVFDISDSYMLGFTTPCEWNDRCSDPLADLLSFDKTVKQQYYGKP